MHEPLLLLGASVRAAAQSAARAGLTPICGDLFGDDDLPDVSVGQVARSFPNDLIRIAAETPEAPWMYTGGLENHPDVVAEISQTRELYGNSAEVLRRVRDPFLLQRVLGEAGLLFAECRDLNAPPPRDGHWLWKHRRSSGGLRVQPWLNETKFATTRSHYFQRRIDGTPLGAVYVAIAGSAQVVGASEQLISGSPEAPFRYGGAIGPVALVDGHQRYLQRLGEILAEWFELRGLFGVDVISADDGLWAIEVNPRYTASVELLERAYSFNAIAMHIDACRDVRLPHPTTSIQGRRWGKAIVYAKRSQPMTADMLLRLRELNRGAMYPNVADLPRAGTTIAREQPALTVFADGADRSTVLAELTRRTAELRDRLAG